MNVSYGWLREMVSFELSPEQLRDLITERCVTVDEVLRLREDLRDVVIGVVVEATPHPGSDRLTLTRVDAGSGELLEVVCGAPNVRVGARYPFARVGSTLPGGLRLEKKKIRGVLSNGMLCSARELALGEDSEGILELQTDAAPGTPLLEARPLGDTRLVLDVTPNRPDLLSHIGVAREIGAALGLPVRLADISPNGGPPSPGGERAVANPPVRRDAQSVELSGVRVELLDQSGCPRYTGAVIRGVRVAPSPPWLAERLAAVGARPINNVVDITNYLLHELGQPMHAFDLARLEGPAVVIRRAHEGERLRTIDSTERALDPSMTVIADASRAQAIAGVMGGSDSEVDDATTDIFLEVAHFSPDAVRRTRRTLGMSSDASYRFERGTDPELPLVAAARAVSMLEAITGGRLDGGIADLRGRAFDPLPVPLRVDRVARVLGEPIPAEEIERLLASIGFDVDQPAEGSLLIVRAPTWRPDVTSEIDVIEEVARLRGYDAFSDALRPFRVGTSPDSPIDALAERMRDLLVSEGLLEARPMPFVVGSTDGHVRVMNPVSESEAYLRRELLESLARRAEYNLAHMQRSVRLFEVGHVFESAGTELPREELRAGAILLGDRRPAHWTEPQPPPFDEWDAKALGEVLARAVATAAEPVELRGGGGDGPVLWEIFIGGTRRGVVTRVALDAPVWAAPAFGVEVTLAVIPSHQVAPPGEARHETAEWPAARPRAAPYQPLPVTPAAEFDLALVVPSSLEAARVEDVIRGAAGEMLERLELFDQYRGAPVPEGYRSIAWRLTFRHPERTLRDKEIAGRRDKLLRTLEGELGVRPRTT